MKQIVFALIVAITITGGVLYWFAKNMGIPAPEPSSSTDAQAPKPSVVSTAPITVITQNLDTPWAIAFLPDNSMLVTERKGTVRLVSREGKFDEAPVATLQNVQEIGEGGLMGIVLHPDFSSNHYVYLYYTYTGSGNNTLNRVVRMIYENSQLSDEQIIVDAIPGAVNHNGGRIKFGPDKSLYIATGDAQDPSQAQDRNSLAGKILRVTDAGKAVPGNPFGTMVYSYGHRNPQGLAWDSNDVL
jgi:glucose/arabinose dehydrogenase